MGTLFIHSRAGAGGGTELAWCDESWCDRLHRDWVSHHPRSRERVLSQAVQVSGRRDSFGSRNGGIVPGVLCSFVDDEPIRAAWYSGRRKAGDGSITTRSPLSSFPVEQARGRS